MNIECHVRIRTKEVTHSTWLCIGNFMGFHIVFGISLLADPLFTQKGCGAKWCVYFSIYRSSWGGIGGFVSNLL